MYTTILNLFFPKIFYAFSHLFTDNETHICTKCRHNLPVTNYHFDNNNTVEKVFYGRVKIEHATSLLKFQKKESTLEQFKRNFHYLKH